MRRLLGTVVGGMLLLWTIAASAGDVVKIGLIASYTGAFATWGSQFQQAVEAYRALHGNTVKGPGGEEIEIQFVYRDTASQGPDKAKQLAEELNAATASITRMSSYFVRVSQTVPQDVAPLGPWAVAHGIKRVYTIVSDYAPGYDAETYFTKTFKAAGGEIVGSARTPQQETNFSAYMERALQALPPRTFARPIYLVVAVVAAP